MEDSPPYRYSSVEDYNWEEVVQDINKCDKALRMSGGFLFVTRNNDLPIGNRDFPTVDRGFPLHVGFPLCMFV